MSLNIDDEATVGISGTTIKRLSRPGTLFGSAFYHGSTAFWANQIRLCLHGDRGSLVGCGDRRDFRGFGGENGILFCIVHRIFLMGIQKEVGQFPKHLIRDLAVRGGIRFFDVFIKLIGANNLSFDFLFSKARI